MNKHEDKICPRCEDSFTCKTGDVANCQCNTIKLEAGVYDLISKKYNDCLCNKCLLELNTKPFFFKEKFGNSPH